MIPKIIHQIWIGTKEAPYKLMDTWKLMNPGFEYIRWNEELINERLDQRCADKINEIEEYAGKADIIRLKFLYKYGGIYIDADSVCIEPLDDFLWNHKSFAFYENEKVIPGLVANGTMAFYPEHPMVGKMIDWIEHNEVSIQKTGKRAWQTVGPCLLTRFLQETPNHEVSILESHYFYPVHHTGTKYEGHGKAYSHQIWGSSHDSYAGMNELQIPIHLLKPEKLISICVINELDSKELILKFLNSLKNQIGHFNIQIDWIDNTNVAEEPIRDFLQTVRFISIEYTTNPTEPLYKTSNLLAPEDLLRIFVDQHLYSTILPSMSD